MLFSQHGHLTLAHTELRDRRAARARRDQPALRRRQPVIGRDEIARLVPALDLLEPPALPDPGRALSPARRHHPPRRRGVGLRARRQPSWASRSTRSPRSPGSTSRTARSPASRRRAATSGPAPSSTRRPAGLDDRADGRPRGCPITTHPLQALRDRAAQAVPRPGARLGDAPRLRQPDRPRRAASSARRSTRTRRTATARRCRSSSRRPHTRWSCCRALAGVKVLRQWAGICDMTPDYSARSWASCRASAGFILDVGWGTYGFKAGPVAGRRMAELIATGGRPSSSSRSRSRGSPRVASSARRRRRRSRTRELQGGLGRPL